MDCTVARSCTIFFYSIDLPILYQTKPIKSRILAKIKQKMQHKKPFAGCSFDALNLLMR